MLFRPKAARYFPPKSPADAFYADLSGLATAGLAFM
jgi:hypothetical protein